MAELVDALDSKSSFRKEVWVRFPLEVQKPSKSFDLLGFVMNNNMVTNFFLERTCRFYTIFI